jgi:hypothetical protein
VTRKEHKQKSEEEITQNHSNSIGCKTNAENAEAQPVETGKITRNSTNNTSEMFPHPRNFWNEIRGEPAIEQFQMWLTIIVVLFTGLLAAFSAYQSFLFRESVRIENRAYIVITDIAIGKPEVGKVITYTWGYKNVGKTPANNLKMRFFCEEGDYKLPDADRDTLNQLTVNDDGISVGGETPFRQDGVFPRTLTREDSINITTETIWLFCAGEIVYRDIFGNDHKTAFGAAYDWKSNTTGFIPNYNSTD